jgi:hypothetical protein
MRRPDAAAIGSAVAQARARPFVRGVVTSTAPFLVAVGGSTPAVPLPRMGDYTPAVNDHVLIAVVDDGDLVVIGNFI